jgi:ribonuclease HI
LGISNNTLDELMTLYHGLKIARASGYHRFFCYSDSKTVLDLVTKGYNNYHCYVIVIANIQDLLELDWDVSLCHTLREWNACTDFLAELAQLMTRSFQFGNLRLMI